jgi:hypothetical protein
MKVKLFPRVRRGLGQTRRERDARVERNALRPASGLVRPAGLGAGAASRARCAAGRCEPTSPSASRSSKNAPRFSQDSSTYPAQRLRPSRLGCVARCDGTPPVPEQQQQQTAAADSSSSSSSSSRQQQQQQQQTAAASSSSSQQQPAAASSSQQQPAASSIQQQPAAASSSGRERHRGDACLLGLFEPRAGRVELLHLTPRGSGVFPEPARAVGGQRAPASPKLVII